MSKKFALLDMENVQPTSLQKLKNEGYHLKVFVGANQSKISVELAEEIQTFGESAQYIRIQSSGKNALDFHIAFYMGQLASTEPDSQFVIVSKDTGYDPLLKHMRNIGIKATRSSAAVGSTTTPAKPTKPTEQTTVTNKNLPKEWHLRTNTYRKQAKLNQGNLRVWRPICTQNSRRSLTKSLSKA